MSACATPVPLATLVDYWAGDLGEGEQGQLEEHVFACDGCHRRLVAVAQLAQGVAAMARRRGGLRMGLTESLARRLADDGLRMREYRVTPGQIVPCGVGRSDDLVVSRLKADLRGVERVDVTMAMGGRLLDRIEDVPFDREAACVIIADSAETMRTWPAMTLLVQLVAVDPAGERTLAQYTFDHAGIVD